MALIEFQVIDVDYVIVNDKPIVRVFGKSLDGKTVCGFYEGYSPYLYTKGDPTNHVKDNQNVLKIEKSETQTVAHEKDIYKITLKNPAKVPETRIELSQYFEVFEADILFKNRFMADFGIGGLCWVKVEYTNINTSTVGTNKMFKIGSIERIEKEEEADFKTLAVDIECVSTTEAKMPDPKRDPVILVGIAFSHEYKGKKYLNLGTRSGKDILSFHTEKEMLEELVKIINEYDPDFVTGYNVGPFDIPYILDRMRECKIVPMFSRCRQKQVVAKVIGTNTRVTMVGRVVVDSLQIIRSDYSLTRYGLDFVAPALLGKEKGDVKRSKIIEYWKGSQDKYDELVEYCKNDTLLSLELVEKLNLLNKYTSLSKVSGVVLQEALDSGETSRIELYLLKEFNKKGYVFPCKPSAVDVKKRAKLNKEELKGGFVLEPKKGLHSNVAVLDFKSMYPSIIRTFNICPTTKVRDGKTENATKTASGVWFYNADYRKGIVPDILENLMNRRQEAKKKHKNAKDTAKKNMYYGEQWALKILANAFYGYLGYARARIFDLDIANTITSSGREIIHGTIEKLEAQGFEIIYSDTDSVFVQMKTDDMEEIRSTATRISKEITEGLPGVMELEFEKVFKRFLPLAKKRYVAWKFEPTKDGWEEKMEMKGVETVRRDWCRLVTGTMKNILDILLKENDTKKALIYFKSIVNKLGRNQIELDDLSITKGITKSPENYAGVQPHVEVMKKMLSRGETPSVGDRISYVIVKGMDLLSRRAEDPTFVKENGLQIDSRYYIDNQLLPPLERIFNALGIDKSELVGGGKQMGLFEAIKIGNGTKKEKKLEEVTGFICKDCSKYYQRPSLDGRCSCGGDFLFNTKEGPIEEVLVN